MFTKNNDNNNKTQDSLGYQPLAYCHQQRGSKPSLFKKPTYCLSHFVEDYLYRARNFFDSSRVCSINSVVASSRKANSLSE